MVKILFYINTIQRGGAERVMVNLANQFDKDGYIVVFVTSFRTKGEYILNKSVKHISLEKVKNERSKIKRNVSRIFKLRKICKSEKPDIMISFMAEPSIRSVLATVGLPVKNLVSVRNAPEQEYAGKLLRFCGKVLLPFANGCVFQTEDAKKWFPRKLQEKSKIICNAVAPDFFSIVRKPVKNCVVTCGRLEEQKNHIMLLKAFKNIIKSYSDAKLLIYGEGTLKSKLENYLYKNGIQENILFKGVNNKVQEALSEADIFVLSSDYEGMPNALLEAMAMGIPCISTDCPCGGPKMIMKNGENGVLVPVGDGEMMENAIIRLFKDDNLKNSLGDAAKKQAKEFAPDIVYKQWESYVLKIVNLGR